jgi:hypothetical protein
MRKLLIAAATLARDSGFRGRHAGQGTGSAATAAV